MGSAVVAGIGGQIAGNLANKVVGEITGNEGGLISSLAGMAAGSAAGGGGGGNWMGITAPADRSSQFSKAIRGAQDKAIGAAKASNWADLMSGGDWISGIERPAGGSHNWTAGIERPGFSFNGRNVLDNSQESGGVLGDLGSKLGGWFSDADNKNFLLEAGLGVLPYVMDMFKEDEEPIDMGGGGYRPPVATGGPGYGGGGGGGQYGLSWSFGQPQGGGGGGYKPGRV